MTSFIEFQNPDFEINFIMNEISRVIQYQTQQTQSEPGLYSLRTCLALFIYVYIYYLFICKLFLESTSDSGSDN